MDAKQIAKESIQQAKLRLHATVWNFLSPEVAQDILVAFAVERSLDLIRQFDPLRASDASLQDVKNITEEIRQQVYGYEKEE